MQNIRQSARNALLRSFDMTLPKKLAMLTRGVAAFSLLMLTLPAFVAAEVIDGIAAIVNEDIITVHELNREYAVISGELEKREGALSAEAAKKLRGDVLNSLIDRKLVRDKVKELNIVVSDEEIRLSIEDIKKQNHLSQEALVAALLAQGTSFEQYKAQMKDQLERLRLMSQEVKAKIQISERELREYYDGNQALFSEVPAYRARHIFLKVPKNASNEEIKKIMEKALTVMAEAKSEADFAGLAKKYSDDPGAAADGGDLGTFKKGDMLPEIESAVITMNPGEVSDIVTTPAGFHIIKLEEKSALQVKPFETVKVTIEETLYRKKSEERFKQWAEELRKGAAVEIKP
jgi:peptidyl-prolyl cis-trans isomerase SurA